MAAAFASEFEPTPGKQVVQGSRVQRLSCCSPVDGFAVAPHLESFESRPTANIASTLTDMGMIGSVMTQPRGKADRGRVLGLPPGKPSVQCRVCGVRLLAVTPSASFTTRATNRLLPQTTWSRPRRFATG